jgi:uncharacterized protein (DUF362 family)/NAD-dependent dihydropyrimidine dehydrogenase PreA subunit
MESVVSIRGCDQYEPGPLREVMEKIFSDLGGPAAFVKRGDRVLLKPNLLLASAPHKAIVTHPNVVEAVASILSDAGAKLFLGDSPPIGRLARTLTKSGYDPFMKRLGVEPVPFLKKHSVGFPEDRDYRRIEIAGEALEYDKVVNLAKLKAHSQMFLTLAVKNLFGVIIGMDKASWHLHAGMDYDKFAAVLVQIFEAVNPCLSIVDGILGMEGDGPNAGTPREVGVIGASRDAVALDATLCRLLGFEIERVKTCAVGQAMGLGVADPERIRVVGDEPEGFPLKDFKPPKSMMSLTWNMAPRNPIRKFLENNMIPRPNIDPETCSRCGTCLEHCPPRAIEERKGRMIIDYKKCISCFCCQELCTTKAIDTVRPWLGKVLSRLLR